MTKRALLLINSKARKGRDHLTEAIDTLESLDFKLITPAIESGQSFGDFVHQYRDQVDRVIVGGGDGTMNAVADALLKTQLPLGILPLGTANDLARTLGIPDAIPDACRVIAADRIRAIDLGWVNGKHFFNVANMGLGVKITRQMSSRDKKRWGIFAYALTTLRVIAQARPFTAEIRIKDESFLVRTLQIAIGNGRYYGGGIAIAQDATIDAQTLDFYSLEIQNRWQLLPFAFTFPQGEQAMLPWVRSLKTEAIEIHTETPQAIVTDGEQTTSTPATFRVVPEALRVFVP